MQTVPLGKPFNRRDLLLTDTAHLGDARSAAIAVDQDRAGAALALSAAVLGAGQIKLIAQDAEQAGVCVCIDGARASIYVQVRNRAMPKPRHYRGGAEKLGGHLRKRRPL